MLVIRSLYTHWSDKQKATCSIAAAFCYHSACQPRTAILSLFGIAVQHSSRQPNRFGFYRAWGGYLEYKARFSRWQTDRCSTRRLGDWHPTRFGGWFNLVQQWHPNLQCNCSGAQQRLHDRSRFLPNEAIQFAHLDNIFPTVATLVAVVPHMFWPNA